MFSTCPSVRSFVCYQTVEHDILKTNEPIFDANWHKTRPKIDMGVRVKIKGVLQGGGSWRAIASLEKIFRSTPPPTPLESRFQPQLTPLENIQKRSK